MPSLSRTDISLAFARDRRLGLLFAFADHDFNPVASQLVAIGLIFQVNDQGGEPDRHSRILVGAELIAEIGKASFL
jgi:hypothetical protein